ncbi:hypothetical protein AB0M19_25350 [Streptomyces sp. NPDC051920]|uniref:hypothetical protein n=1 Tax=Streptomyces sp. NPDC051920 TaxID=3155523 RepID=UPI003430EE64
MSDVESPQPDGLIARLTQMEKPADVVQAGATCLAQMLDGFNWVSSRQSLERRRAGRREVITLEKSKWNRSGQSIQFIVANLTVFDDGLAAWRRANPELTVRRPESVEAIVCASSFLDTSSEHDVMLTRPEERWARLEQCATHLRGTALPWFAGSADPERLPQTVPDTLLTARGFAQDLIEFLISSGHHAQARELWKRVLERNAAHQQAFTAGQDMARSGEEPRWHTPEALGWSASVLRLR